MQGAEEEEGEEAEEEKGVEAEEEEGVEAEEEEGVEAEEEEVEEAEEEEVEVGVLRFDFAGTRRLSATGGHLVGPGDILPTGS